MKIGHLPTQHASIKTTQRCNRSINSCRAVDEDQAFSLTQIELQIHIMHHPKKYSHVQQAITPSSSESQENIPMFNCLHPQILPISMALLCFREPANLQ
jgi:hypothetical protein